MNNLLKQRLLRYLYKQACPSHWQLLQLRDSSRKEHTYRVRYLIKTNAFQDCLTCKKLVVYENRGTINLLVITEIYYDIVYLHSGCKGTDIQILKSL